MKSHASTLFMLGQLNDLLTTMSSEEYSKPISICNGSTVGMHVRHILELYQCLLTNYQSGVIDYEKRPRNQQMECNKDFTSTIIYDVVKNVECLQQDALLYVIDTSDNTGTKPYLIQSTLYRELMYNEEHCIHHMALIAMCVRSEFSHITLSRDFGKAYSTIRHEKNSICAQ